MGASPFLSQYEGEEARPRGIDRPVVHELERRRRDLGMAGEPLAQRTSRFATPLCHAPAAHVQRRGDMHRFEVRKLVPRPLEVLTRASGVVLWDIIRSFQYPETCAVLAIIVVTVTALDLASARVRKLFV